MRFSNIHTWLLVSIIAISLGAAHYSLATPPPQFPPKGRPTPWNVKNSKGVQVQHYEDDLHWSSQFVYIDPKEIKEIESILAPKGTPRSPKILIKNLDFSNVWNEATQYTSGELSVITEKDKEEYKRFVKEYTKEIKASNFIDTIYDKKPPADYVRYINSEKAGQPTGYVVNWAYSEYLAWTKQYVKSIRGTITFFAPTSVPVRVLTYFYKNKKGDYVYNWNENIHRFPKLYVLELMKQQQASTPSNPKTQITEMEPIPPVKIPIEPTIVTELPESSIPPIVFPQKTNFTVRVVSKLYYMSKQDVQKRLTFNPPYPLRQWWLGSTGTPLESHPMDTPDLSSLCFHRSWHGLHRGCQLSISQNSD